MAVVKLELAFVTTTQEEASATSANLNQRGRSWLYSRGYGGCSNFKGQYGHGETIKRNEYRGPMNSKWRDGNPLTCHGCASYRHLWRLVHTLIKMQVGHRK